MHNLKKLFLTSLIFAAPAFAAVPTSIPAVANLPVVIMDTGSTNMSGYRAEILSNGVVRLYGDTGMIPKTIPVLLAHKLFDDTAAAGKLSALPRQSCMKSASFSSRLTVGWKGEETPDLSCPTGNKAMQTLQDDIQQIKKAVPVRPGTRRFLNLPKR